MTELQDFDDQKTWDRICSEHGTIFHMWDWLKTIEKVFGASFKPLGLFENRELVGVFPVFTCRKAFNLLMSPLHGCATPYGGPVVSGKTQGMRGNYTRILGALSESPYHHRSHFTYIVSTPILSYNNYLEQVRLSYDLGKVQRKYEFSNQYTILLNLNTSQDLLWENLGKKCRTAVRKALKSGIEVVETTSEEVENSYYLMARETYGRSNQPPGIPREMFRAVSKTFETNKKMKILTAKYKGRVIAASIFLFHNDVIYYWDNVSFREYSSLAPNNLIQWTIIKWGNENHYFSYDLLGAGMTKIAEFKLGFGGEIVPSIIAKKYKNSCVRFGAKTYEKVFPVCRQLTYRLNRLRGTI